MNRKWFIARRIVWMVIAIWLILSGAFFLFAYTPDPNQALALFGVGIGAENQSEAVRMQQEALQEFRESRNYDEPVLQRYTKWMIDYATFDWGETLGGRPVIDVIKKRALATLAYLLPGLLLGLIGGVAIGLYSATHHHSLFDRLGTFFAYVGVGIPHFFLAEALLVIAIKEFSWYAVEMDNRYGLWTPRNIQIFILPTVVLAVNVLAAQLRYARAESLEYMPRDFVKTLKASGARTRDIARHIFRNASIPLVSLFFTEVLAVLYVTIIVIEVVFGIPGLGRLTFGAIKQRDIGLILGTTFIPVFLGVFGSFVQDIVYTVIDPKIGYDERD